MQLTSYSVQARNMVCGGPKYKSLLRRPMKKKVSNILKKNDSILHVERFSWCGCPVLHRLQSLLQMKDFHLQIIMNNINLVHAPRTPGTQTSPHARQHR